MEPNQYGTLRIRTFAASDAIPIKDARVTIEGVDEFSGGIVQALLTDEDGLTPKVSLPTPNVSYSLSPHPAEVPYSVYDVEISKDGYYTKIIRNVAVFAGIDAVLPVNMIPFSSGTDYPRGNINATVTENEYLEM